MSQQTTRPFDHNDKWLVDDEGYVVGVRCAGLSRDFAFVLGEVDPITGGITGQTSGGEQIMVISADAPSDGDGRLDGTIYIQTV